MQLLCGLETALLFSSVDKLEVMGSHLATHYGIPRTFWAWVFSCRLGAPSLWRQGGVEETTAGIPFPDHQQSSRAAAQVAVRPLVTASAFLLQRLQLRGREPSRH